MATHKIIQYKNRDRKTRMKMNENSIIKNEKYLKLLFEANANIL